MPFNLLSDVVFEQLIRPIARAAGYRVERADTVLNQRAIMQDVVRGILEADLVLADLTGRNSNVFYELGIAHAARRPVILLAQSTADIPFDLKAYRAVIYSLAFDLEMTLSSSMSSDLPPLLAAARSGDIVFSNPMEDYGDEIAPGDDGQQADDEGVLEVIARFQDITAPAATDAMTSIGREVELATQEMNAAMEALPQADDLTPAEALVRARNLADQIAGIWDRSADRLEPLVSDAYAPSVLAIEADVSALLRSHQRAAGAIDLGEFFEATRGLAEPSSEFAATIRQTILIIGRNSQWSTAQIRSGARLAAIYERIAGQADRIVALAAAAEEALGQTPGQPN